MARPGCDIPALTSLRIIAALGVFVSHLPYTDRSPILRPFILLFSEGFIGVPFFFILSGFVLTTGLAGASFRWLRRPRDG